MEQGEEHVLGSKGAPGPNPDASIYDCEPVPISTMRMTSATSRASVGQRRRDTWRSVSVQEMTAPSPALPAQSLHHSELPAINHQSINPRAGGEFLFLPNSHCGLTQRDTA